ncbi:MAG: tRNA-binding protein [Cyclobacteriaceae bacterium]
MINWKDFEKVDMRVGTVLSAEPFPEARKPAYKLRIDLGTEIGLKRSSAQITDHYDVGDLVGRQVICVVNFPPKQIGPLISECLVMGAYDDHGKVILLQPSKALSNGSQIG